MDIVEHYKEVRRRLNTVPPKPPKPPKPQPPKPVHPEILTPYQRTVRESAIPILKKYDLTLEDVRGERRFRCMHRARWEIAVALTNRGWSTLKIGRFLNKDHTTVVHYLKRLKEESQNGTA